jgi:hypothetical protein
MRQFHGGGATVSGPSLLGQQAPGAATVPQPDLMVASMAPDGSGCSGSTSTSREVLAAATKVEKAAKMRTAEEATMAKATEEATTTKVATGKAATNKVATDKAVADKVVADKVVAEKVATDKAVTTKVAVAKAAADETNQLDAQTQKLLHEGAVRHG